MVAVTDAASMAMSIAAGAVKLGRKIDELVAEEIAVKSAMATRFPSFSVGPDAATLQKALRVFLAETKDVSPDPVEGRARLERLSQSPQATTTKLWVELARYGRADFDVEVIAPDEAFKSLLVAGKVNWDFDDDDLVHLTYYLAAGPERRQGSLRFRLAAAVVDVLAEFAADNMQSLVRDENARKVLETILRKFSEPDLEKMSSWGQVLKHVVRATVNGLIDTRDLWHDNRFWLESLLSAIAEARTKSKKGDDFVLGLFQGEGIKYLIGAVLEEGAKALSREDAGVVQSVLSDVLVIAAKRAQEADDFEQFFRENWQGLVGAGLRSLNAHGPRVLQGSTPLLQKTLGVMVGALADAVESKRPLGDTLIATVEAVVAVVAEQPNLLDAAKGKKWVKALVVSVASVIDERGLRKAFSRAALESYARGALTVLAQHPHVLAKDSEIAQKLVSGLLGRLATAKIGGLESMADTVVAAALATLAEHHGLLDSDFAPVLGDVADALATLVEKKSISGIDAGDLIGVAAEVIAGNPALFLALEKKAASKIVRAILETVESAKLGVLTGSLGIEAVRRILDVVAARGIAALENQTLTTLINRLKKLLANALTTAKAELGRNVTGHQLPLVFALLVDAWLSGEIKPTADVEEKFVEIAEALIATAA